MINIIYCRDCNPKMVLSSGNCVLPASHELADATVHAHCGLIEVNETFDSSSYESSDAWHSYLFDKYQNQMN